ncbi:MAG: competence/damage-inducible protein A [Acidobacteriota bacterium]|nr:competence/damage-inducible protein A [Acidobacteriota bacterium]
MKAAILAIGSELLGPDRLDTNSLELTETLERHGVELVSKQVVGDDVERIERVLRQLAADADLILVTGGLGPTADDVTREGVARATGRELSEDPAIVEEIRRKFAAFGREMPEVNRRQAAVLAGAEVLENPRGTAPGLLLEHEGTTFFLFPGVPTELQGMVAHRLEPWLAARRPRPPRARRILRVACLPESRVEELLEPVYARFGALGILASPGDIRIRLEGASAAELEAVETAARECLGSAVYGTGAQSLEEVVGDGLRRRGLTIATAESCTGGWIAQRLTAVAGSSDYFVGSVVAYSDRVKREHLGVPREILERCGAVSPEVVALMASGVAQRLGSDWGLAVSGVAGPGGGTEAKPVGTVDVALFRAREEPSRARLRLPGGRATVRLLATQWALDMVRHALREEAG